jgi:hypothetical protein
MYNMDAIVTQSPNAAMNSPRERERLKKGWVFFLQCHIDCDNVLLFPLAFPFFTFAAFAPCRHLGRSERSGGFFDFSLQAFIVHSRDL